MSVDTSNLNLILNIVTLVLGGGALGIILKYRLGSRKLTLDNEEDIRDHYAQEVAAMRARLDVKDEQFTKMEEHWRRMLEDSDRRHEECQRDRELLRRELEEMHDEVAGLKKQILQYSSDTVIMLEPTKAPHAKESAHRVKKIIEGEGE